MNTPPYLHRYFKKLYPIRPSRQAMRLLYYSLIVLLLCSWGLYHRTQTVLSRQLDQLAVQSLPSDGPNPTLNIRLSRAKGWPFGAWRELSGVSFHTHLNGADVVGATPTLILGGNWLDWARTITTQTKLPLRMPQSTILRLVRNGESLTLRLNKTRLLISKSMMPCPALTARCHNHTMPLYRAYFHIAQLEIAASHLPYTVTLSRPTGSIRFAPQSLVRPDPALQDRALLSASITAERLSYPDTMLKEFDITHLRTQFALLPNLYSAASHTPPQTAQPNLLLRLRLHELSATFRPLAASEQNTPPPHLSLGGTLYVPSFSGVISVSLTNWQCPLHLLIQSQWFQQNVPMSLRSLCHELMTNPRMETLATRPLTVSIPLDHGVPPGLSSSSTRLHSLAEHLRKLDPTP
ncbi:MAG: hypothetical protein M3Z59_03465 [Bombella apis]|nr:hypothetical protein [Bombella apis]